MKRFHGNSILSLNSAISKDEERSKFYVESVKSSYYSMSNSLSKFRNYPFTVYPTIFLDNVPRVINNH